jgi:hypothetical protein
MDPLKKGSKLSHALDFILFALCHYSLNGCEHFRDVDFN